MRILTTAQAAVLSDVVRHLTPHTSHAALAELIDRVGRAIDDSFIALTGGGEEWIRHGSPGAPPPPPAALRDFAASHESVATRAVDGKTWTVITAHAGATTAIVMLEADWTLSAVPLRELATAIARHVASAHGDETPGDSRVTRAARIDRCHYRMLRRLERVSGMTAVADVAVRHLVAALECRVGAAALMTARGDADIVATCGYPRALVEDIRVEPGVGIMGSVLADRRPIVADGPIDGRKPRRRYRTNSFIVVPLLSGSSAVGALSVTDRIDGGAFTRADVSVARMFAASAALAVERERARAQAETSEHAAAVDPVTGVFNRRYLQVRLEEELQRSKRHDISVAALVIDIDDFKIANDSYGHLAGDLLLKDIAEILRRSVRVFDVCARFGGDEFVIVMPGSTGASAARIAERIRARIEQYRSNDRRLDGVRVTVSVGLAVSSREMSASDLLERADRALYEAKRGGKNQVRAELR